MASRVYGAVAATHASSPGPYASHVHALPLLTPPTTSVTMALYVLLSCTVGGVAHVR